MLQDGFHALFRGGIWDGLWSIGGSAVEVDIVTRSGRRFRYNLSHYRFGPDYTETQVLALAAEIASEKYKECDWDRNHPRVAAEAEIAEVLAKLIREAVANMQEAEQEN